MSWEEVFNMNEHKSFVHSSHGTMKENRDWSETNPIDEQR